MQGSSIELIRGEKASFSRVLKMIKSIKLPVVTHYEHGMMHFDYDGLCDGNTAEAVKMVIVGLYKLYEVHT